VDKKLTDSDVNAIVDAIEERMVNRLKINIGAGVLSALWRAIIIVIVGIAAYGSIKGIRWPFQ
jgi:hypothetical protein